MTTKGQFIEKAAASTTQVNLDGSGFNPEVMPETAAEKTMWQKTSPWVHGLLGAVSFVPGLSVISGGLDAAIYAGEGEFVEAGLAAASMIPGGKIVTTVGKVAKGAATMAKGAGAAARVVKGAHESAEMVKAAKLAKEAAESGKLAKEAGKVADAGKATGKGGKNTTVKGRKKGPCDHLRQGNGTGPYRGGAHSKTSKPSNDGKDSHHMPADVVSPLKHNDGPAIQMDPLDHADTSSNGQNGVLGKKYRAEIEAMLLDKKWREAMLKEVQDIRRVAQSAGTPRKYNEAMLEMLEYFKCLEKNRLLP